ncbi:putative NAD -binding protein [Rosellinia necatrix]|uniref:Putative NAD-binding protein n=1 Tax=Rosellinia necatrix TaxID=77044 RepID=A0A1W2TID4_ROSNE|nr:putative NAD -binding protein [Rosellinia necatrix]
MPKIAIIGASGKLGGATLSALLAHGLVAAPRDVVALTSSAAGSPTRGRLAATGVSVRPARFEDPAGLEAALRGVDTLFLVSTPDIALDFGLALDFDGTTAATAAAAAGGEGSGNGNHPGRESHHKNAVDAAVRAGVRRIVYSSLAFAFDPTAGADGNGVGVGDASRAGVMRAHLRTEAYLRAVAAADHGVKVVVLREGLYAESWPLYLGYFDNDAVVGDGDGEGEGEGEGDVVVPLAGDGKICWTAIRDLGVASALVLADADAESEFDGRIVYLATRPATAKTVAEIARLVAAAGGGGGGARDVRVEVVGRREHERYYVAERGLPRPAVEWWAGTYEALEAGECLVDDPTLETLLGRVGLTPIPVEETVAAMVKGRGGWKSRQKEARIGG